MNCAIDCAGAQNKDATDAAKDDGKVVLLSTLLEKADSNKPQSSRENEQAKKDVVINDIVLDFETSQVALQIVSWTHVDKGQRVFAVTPFLPALDGELTTKLSRTMSKSSPASMNRELATVVYKEFGRELYWSQYLKRLPPDAHGNFDRERFELTAFRDLQGKKISDTDGDAVGTLTDVGVNERSGEIVYCVIKSNDESLRAIPLGAFVDRKSKSDWKIELEREQIVLFEPFDKAQPPQAIDRGWQEYVAVRYGRDALQAKPNAKENKQKVEEDK